MKLTMSKEIQDIISKEGIISVLEIESEQDAVSTVKALWEGGVTVIEIALRTPGALPSIKLIAKEVPQIIIGIGTIIVSGQPATIKKHDGVCFGVSPGLNPEIVKEAIAADLPFAPGIATPSELDQAISLGCRTVKFFPAEGMGGLNFLKNMSVPFNHLGIKYIPLGGITQVNLADYAKFDPVLAVGGTWIANKELIKAQNWKEITKRAQEARDIWDNCRSSQRY
jgi:2-dehydro-3-deoxyphosphogluconate aldolase/(4S)-4-hydroxy-2-oxoglutarate aldolase